MRLLVRVSSTVGVRAPSLSCSACVSYIYTLLYIGTQPDPPTHQPNQQPPPQKKNKTKQACGDVVRNINCTPAPFARPEYKYAVEYSKIFAELFKPQVWYGWGQG